MAQIFGTPDREPGDQLVYEVLSSLPDDWIVYAQPKVVFKGEERNPDYVVVHKDVGFLVLEVKDWVNIVEWSSKDANIIRRGSSLEATETSPVDQARKAAYLISNILCEDKDLCGYSGKLDFPYRFAGVLPHQPMPIITQLEQAWGVNCIFGRDDLRPDLIESRLRSVPAPFHMPMEEKHLRAVCASIDPLIRINDPNSGAFKGVYDRQQEQLAKEPIQSSEEPIQIQPHPEQIKLILDPDMEQRMKALEQDLPDEAASLKSAAHVRLVRGFAGTGKTDILVLRARYLVQQNPELKILVTTFNDPLYKERLCPELKDIQDRVDVIKFDTLCSKIYQLRHGRWTNPQDTGGLLRRMAELDPGLEELGVEFLTDEFIWMKETGRVDRQTYTETVREGRGGPDGKRLTKDRKNQVFNVFDCYQSELAEIPAHDWVDLHTRVLSYLQDGIVPVIRYDVILIDEAQHFAPTWMGIIQHFLKDGGDLFLCDDPSQSVYRSYSWQQKGIDVRGRTRWLRVPYRCSRQIFTAAYALIAGNPTAQKLLLESGEQIVPDLDHEAMRDGPIPMIQEFPTIADEQEFILQEIARLVNEEGVLPQEIGILHEENYVLDRYRKAVPKGVKLYEIKRQTGLEYRAVFIPEVQKMDERSLGLSLEEYEARQCVKFYSAMTRARTWLYMTYQQKWPKVLEPLLKREYGQ